MRIRTTITLNDRLYEKAKALMQQGNFDEFSGFLEYLIRSEYERRSEREKEEIRAIIEEMKASQIGKALRNSPGKTQTFPPNRSGSDALNEKPDPPKDG